MALILVLFEIEIMRQVCRKNIKNLGDQKIILMLRGMLGDYSLDPSFKMGSEFYLSPLEGEIR